MKSVSPKVRVVIGINAISVIFLLWAGLWLYFEPPWMTYTKLPFPLVKPGEAIQAGKPISLWVARCSMQPHSRSYTLTHALINVKTGLSTRLPATSASVDAGCTTNVSKINVVPEDQEAGTYVVDGYGEINGRVRTFSLHWMSEPFEVVRPPAPLGKP